jgi:hypothetical protein
VFDFVVEANIGKRAALSGGKLSFGRTRYQQTNEKTGPAWGAEPVDPFFAYVFGKE